MRVVRWPSLAQFYSSTDVERDISLSTTLMAIHPVSEGQTVPWMVRQLNSLQLCLAHVWSVLELPSCSTVLQLQAPNEPDLSVNGSMNSVVQYFTLCLEFCKLSTLQSFTRSTQKVGEDEEDSTKVGENGDAAKEALPN